MVSLTNDVHCTDVQFNSGLKVWQNKLSQAQAITSLLWYINVCAGSGQITADSVAINIWVDVCNVQGKW